MIHELLPTSYARHLSLPLLGPVVDDFDDWLIIQGYRFNSRQCYVLRCTAIDAYFHKRHQRSLTALTPENLRKRPVQKDRSVWLRMFQQTSEQASLMNAS